VARGGERVSATVLARSLEPVELSGRHDPEGGDGGEHARFYGARRTVTYQDLEGNMMQVVLASNVSVRLVEDGRLDTAV